jgi:hypothetical protein
MSLKRGRPRGKNPHLRWLQKMRRSPRWVALARKAVWQKQNRNNLLWSLTIFGPYICAEEAIKMYKLKCKTSGTNYNREFAITEAAKMVGMKRDTLANYLNRADKAR